MGNSPAIYEAWREHAAREAARESNPPTVFPCSTDEAHKPHGWSAQTQTEYRCPGKSSLIFIPYSHCAEYDASADYEEAPEAPEEMRLDYYDDDDEEYWSFGRMDY